MELHSRAFLYPRNPVIDRAHRSHDTVILLVSCMCLFLRRVCEEIRPTLSFSSLGVIVMLIDMLQAPVTINIRILVDEAESSPLGYGPRSVNQTTQSFGQIAIDRYGSAINWNGFCEATTVFQCVRKVRESYVERWVSFDGPSIQPLHYA